MKKILISIVLVSALFIFSHKVNARYLTQVATTTPTTALTTTPTTALTATPTTQLTATPTGGLTELPQTGKVLPIIIIVSIAGFLIYYGFREKII